jgi:hypothetical protein
MDPKRPYLGIFLWGAAFASFTIPGQAADLFSFRDQGGVLAFTEIV